MWSKSTQQWHDTKIHALTWKMAYGGLLVMSASLTLSTCCPAVADYDVPVVRLPTWSCAESTGGDFKWAGSKNRQKYPHVGKMPFYGQKTHLFPLCAEIKFERFFYRLISISRPRAFTWRAARVQKRGGGAELDGIMWKTRFENFI